MKDMANDFALKEGRSCLRQQAITWFAQKYPKIKQGTVTAHLIRLSTNAPSRVHYNPKPGDDDVFFQMDGNRFRLYDIANDPTPISIIETPAAEDDASNSGNELVEAKTATEFAYEADLRDYLAKNLPIIEPGLRLYQDEDITGIEFPVGGRFIDILAIDAQNNFVVIELKVSRGYDRVIGQLMRYMACIKQHQAEATQQVRGIIIARKISEDLILASSLVENIQLFEYELSLALRSIEAQLA